MECEMFVIVRSQD